jgi:hypothetical protein
MLDFLAFVNVVAAGVKMMMTPKYSKILQTT